VFESVVARTLRDLGVRFAHNEASRDGLLHFDFLIRARLECAARSSAVAVPACRLSSRVAARTERSFPNHCRDTLYYMLASAKRSALTQQMLCSPEGAAAGFTSVALDLWRPDHVTVGADGKPHALAAAVVRMRLAAARHVRLVPVAYQEWAMLSSNEQRATLLARKLVAAGISGPWSERC
jgi:hypothetical protein